MPGATTSQGSEVYDPVALSQELGKLFQERVDQLSRDGEIALFDVKIFVAQRLYAPTQRVQGAPNVWSQCGMLMNERGEPVMMAHTHSIFTNLAFGPWAWISKLGVIPWLHRRAFERLGKEEFLERRWKSFAKELFKQDAKLRACHGVGLPPAKAAREEAKELERAARPAKAAVKRARAL